jgi:hypothetical protein
MTTHASHILLASCVRGGSSLCGTVTGCAWFYLFVCHLAHCPRGHQVHWRRGHVVQMWTSPRGPSAEALAGVTYCGEGSHVGLTYPLTHFCTTCARLVCVHCCVDTHLPAHHTVHPVPDAAAAAVTSLQAALPALSASAERWRCVEAAARSAHTQLDASKATVTAAVEVQAEALRQLLEHQRTTLLGNIESLHRFKSAQVSRTLASAHSALCELATVQAVASSALASSDPVLQVHVGATLTLSSPLLIEGTSWNDSVPSHLGEDLVYEPGEPGPTMHLGVVGLTSSSGGADGAPQRTVSSHLPCAPPRPSLGTPLCTGPAVLPHHEGMGSGTSGTFISSTSKPSPFTGPSIPASFDPVDCASSVSGGHDECSPAPAPAHAPSTREPRPSSTRDAGSRIPSTTPMDASGPASASALNIEWDDEVAALEAEPGEEVSISGTLCTHEGGTPPAVAMFANSLSTTVVLSKPRLWLAVTDRVFGQTPWYQDDEEDPSMLGTSGSAGAGSGGTSAGPGRGAAPPRPTESVPAVITVLDAERGRFTVTFTAPSRRSCFAARAAVSVFLQGSRLPSPFRFMVLHPLLFAGTSSPVRRGSLVAIPNQHKHSLTHTYPHTAHPVTVSDYRFAFVAS